jgi:3-oxoacyl-[acyl-carrier protein] reductase
MTESGSKIIMVTGGTRGIGRAIAAGLAGPAAKVILTGRDEARVRAAAAEVGAETGQFVAGVAFDMSDFPATGAAIRAVASEHGGLDALILNAGIMMNAPLGAIEYGQVRQTLDANVAGSIAGVQAAARCMMRRKRGAIVLVASIVGRDGAAGQVTYAASKAAVAAITRSAAKELGRWGIRVNAVAPGIITTGMLGDVPEVVLAQRTAATPLGRLGAPEDVARVVRFLVSDESAFVTGQVVAVDGGLAL